MACMRLAESTKKSEQNFLCGMSRPGRGRVLTPHFTSSAIRDLLLIYIAWATIHRSNKLHRQRQRQSQSQLLLQTSTEQSTVPTIQL
jgi:hypothetical protein